MRYKLAIILFAGIAAFVAASQLMGGGGPPSKIPSAPSTYMKIISPTFAHQNPIPSQYTCDGGDINPTLQITEVPSQAKSLALIMDDPDAPGGTFTHWLMWNIDPATTLIEEGSRPEGVVEGVNSASETRYIGPCPPSGMHHYHFKLYALDSMLDVPSKTSKTHLEEEIKKHLIKSAELVGTYQRR